MMHDEEEAKRTPSSREQTRWDPVGGGGQNGEIVISPGFKSVAAMAGWDEESIIASLSVEDTPDREKTGSSKHRKRSDLNFKTPPSTNLRWKRRAYRKSPMVIRVQVLNLDEEEPAKQDGGKMTVGGPKISAKGKGGEEGEGHQSEEDKFSSSVLPCIDKLREELSCAICLEICFEPSTTSCGHSFCKKCLRNAADKCGKKCPKCRQLISNGRSCTINTVLWNTIQLLFPEEVEGRKASKEVLKSEESENGGTYGRRSIDPTRDAGFRFLRVSRRTTPSNSEGRTLMPSLDEGSQLAPSLGRDVLHRLGTRRSRRRGTPTPASQNEDAALALRLQREEFMEAFRGTDEQSRSSISVARENPRAMASRAISNRMRYRDL